jgi:hypothetical protein
VGLRARLAAELEAYLPEEAVGRLAADALLSPIELADRGIRGLAASALEGSGPSDAAARIRALPPLTSAQTARSTMQALERIAHSTGAPGGPIRAASQVAGAIVALHAPGGESRAEAQLIAAIVRLAHAAVRAGVPAVDAISLLNAPPA